jgi:hypothetical protein
MRSAVGLQPNIVLKTIRHSIATHLRTRRVPGEEIETLLGQRVLKGTTGVYAKYDPDYLRQATKVLSKVWQEVWTASEAWVAVHTLSILVRGQPLKIVKKAQICVSGG